MGGLSTFVGSDGFTRFVQTEDDNGFIPEKITRSSWSNIIRQKAKDTYEENKGFDEFIEELMELGIEVEGEETKDKSTFFRDASGVILRKDSFYPSSEFWGRVNKNIVKALKDRYEPTPF